MTEGVDLVRGVEVDAVNLVHDVPQEISINHEVDGAFKDGSYYIAAVAAICSL